MNSTDKIPEVYLEKALDLSHVGCLCSFEDADDAEFSCEHYRDHYCQCQADHIARALMEAVETERERCAKIAENERDGMEPGWAMDDTYENGFYHAADVISNAIRALGGKG